MATEYPNRNVYGEHETTTIVPAPPALEDGRSMTMLRVRVKMERGFWSWSCPDAATMRRQVDAALAGTGWRRDGRRHYAGDGPVTEWCYHYYAVPA